jgi:non-ribosomal peptide synthetase component F
MTYTDVLHIYGVSRAGYVPQLFSLGLPNPAVIFELLQLADAQALIFDPSFESAVTDCHIPTHLAVNYESMHDDGILPSLPKALSGDETAFVFHTSGSTSGRPKLVPCSYRWLNSTINKARRVCSPRNPSRQDVTVWM